MLLNFGKILNYEVALATQEILIECENISLPIKFTWKLFFSIKVILRISAINITSRKDRKDNLNYLKNLTKPIFLKYFITAVLKSIFLCKTISSYFSVKKNLEHYVQFFK